MAKMPMPRIRGPDWSIEHEYDPVVADQQADHTELDSRYVVSTEGVVID